MQKQESGYALWLLKDSFFMFLFKLYRVRKDKGMSLLQEGAL